MKKLLLASILTIPGIAISEPKIKEGFTVKGKISVIRDTAKYRSVEKCSALQLLKVKQLRLLIMKKENVFYINLLDL